MSALVQEQLVISNDTRYLIVVRDFVARMVRQSRLPAGEENKIILAVDEAVTNIIEHGYDHDEEGQIEIFVEIHADRVVFRILDQGRSFDPGVQGNIVMEEHIRSGKKKGLGIFLMRRIMDEVKYVFREGRRNELQLVKVIRP